MSEKKPKKIKLKMSQKKFEYFQEAQCSRCRFIFDEKEEKCKKCDDNLYRYIKLGKEV